MKAFAQTLADLHHAANHASLQEFPAEAVRLLQKWVAFDGAVLGMGRAELEPQTRLDIADAYVYNRERSILDEYAVVCADDPVTHSFLNGLANPLLCDCHVLYSSQKLEALRAFSRRHDMRHLMIFGQPPAGDAPARWLVAYRGIDVPYNVKDADYLHALWLHLSMALNVNRIRALDRLAPSRTQRALALATPCGTILAADPMFYALLRMEWPDYQEVSLPRPVIEGCLRKRMYRSKHIDIAFAEQGDYLVCSARISSAIARLSPSESRVATLFSAGLSHKEVAQELGVSQHTVRTQLKNSYSKLGVHDKAELTRLIVLHS